MTESAGMLAVRDASGYELVRRRCPRHGDFHFHPAVCGRRNVGCPKCQVERAKPKGRTAGKQVRA